MAIFIVVSTVSIQSYLGSSRGQTPQAPVIINNVPSAISAPQ